MSPLHATLTNLALVRYIFQRNRNAQVLRRSVLESEPPAARTVSNRSSSSKRRIYKASISALACGGFRRKKQKRMVVRRQDLNLRNPRLLIRRLADRQLHTYYARLSEPSAVFPTCHEEVKGKNTQNKHSGGCQQAFHFPC